MGDIIKEIIISPNGDISFWESKELREIASHIGDVRVVGKQIFSADKDLMLCG